MRFIIHAILTAALVATMFLVTGCGENRMSQEQAQALSEARAGVRAAKEIQAKSTPETQAADYQRIMDNLLPGIAAWTDAASATMKLPEPKWQPTVLVDSPEAAPKYAEAAQVAAANPPEGWGVGRWAAFGTMALTAVGTALHLSRNLPGIAGVVGGALSWAWKLWAPDKAKEEEKLAFQAADALKAAIAYGDRVAEIAHGAGFGHLVEDAKLRARMLAERLHVHEPIAAAIEAVRKGPSPLALEKLPPPLKS